MTISRLAMLFFCCMILISGCAQNKKSQPANPPKLSVVKSETEWNKILTPQQFCILREKGTEPAFTGALWDNHRKGTYFCAGCNNPLFSSDTKFESGSGWPSFFQPINENNLLITKDYSHGMIRDEVQCRICGGHLGHLFNDGPEPTGMRYCMNSAALKFVDAATDSTFSGQPVKTTP